MSEERRPDDVAVGEAAGDWAANLKSASTLRQPYSFKPYPGFRDPQDWRESTSGTSVDERRTYLVRELVVNAERDHAFKHRHHDHPWCRLCWHRTAAYESPTPPTPLTEEWEVHDVEGRIATARRANLHLILHGGRPPVDDFDPSLETSFEDEYLDRDELDNLAEPAPLIRGVLPRDSYGVLRGRDGTLKSFTALDWSLCLATGHPWQGRPVERAHVLYVAGEGVSGLRARIEAWERTWGREVEGDWFTVRRSALNLHRPGAALDHLLDVVQERGTGLVVIDTLRRVAGAADGNSSEMGTVVDNLDRIKRATLDGTVLVIAHTDKGDHDTRGYSGVEDDADFVWHAKRDEQLLTLTNAKMKDGIDGAVVQLVARPSHGSLVLQAAGAADLTSNESQLKVLDTLRYTFREGAHSGQLHETSGLAKATFYRALGQLKEAGHVVNVGTVKRPFWTLVVSSGSDDGDAQESHESQSVSPAVSQSIGGGLTVSPVLYVRPETEQLDLDTSGES